MNELPLPLNGGCACGAIRYQATAQPVLMLQCHCRDCQRSSGGAAAPFVVIPKDAFQVTQGELKYYDTPSDAGGLTHRGFCATCGSPLLSNPDAVPNLVAVRAASLDQPEAFTPACDVWTCDALPWDHLNPATAKFEKYPS